MEKLSITHSTKTARFAKHLALAVLIVSAFFSRASAFDLFPEFQVLTEEEQAGFDNTFAIDSEYQGDIWSYIIPLSYEAEFFANKNGFHTGFGSLSNKIFLQETRLKLERELGDGVDFRFTYFQQRDQLFDQTHAVLELVRWFAPEVGISAYGEPSAFKRETDFGLAILYRPQGKSVSEAGHEIRLFHTWVDITRNNHNDRPDTFREGFDPKSVGLVGRCTNCLGDNTYLEYFGRWEQPTKWIFPQTNSEYGYEHQALGFDTRFFVAELLTSARFQYSKKFEGSGPLPGGTAIPQASLDRQIYEGWINTSIPFSEGSLKVEPGIGWVERFWRSDSDALTHRNLSGFVNVALQGARRTEGFDRYEIFYDASGFWGEGSLALRSHELKGATTEHRVGLRYTIPFRDNSELSFMGAADADEGGTFEGGHGSFKTYF